MARSKFIRDVFQPPPDYTSWRQWLWWTFVIYVWAVIGSAVVFVIGTGIYALLVDAAG
jgi:hypothetical protein